ncbi:MAG: hypothetical protein VX536_03940, partial [Pseudomonadota bacterium]|nr:hypothetical protein [Pseudomonadota bacterium]
MCKTSLNAGTSVCLVLFSLLYPLALDEKARMALLLLKIIHELDTKSKLACASRVFEPESER